MPSHKQLAVLSLACFATILTGCNRAGTPQGQVTQAIDKAQIAAASADDTGRQKAISILNSAANTANAPDGSVAQAKAALAEVQLQAASANLKIVNDNDLAASRIALQIASLAGQLGSGATMVDGYNKLEPKAAKVAIDQKITEAKGDTPDSKWINDNGVNLPSLAAVTAKITQLQADIAKKQADAKNLDTQRQAALADAETNMKASESAKDQASVDAYTKASNSKKQAADLQTQMDVIKATIIPLQQDLAAAQGQQQILQKVVAELTDESQTLDEGWQGVQNKIQAQIDLMKQIATAPSSTPAASASTTQSDATVDATITAAGGSIAVKAAAMAQAVAAADKARDDASKNFDEAIKDFKDAQTAASSAVSKLQLATLDQPNLKAVYDQAIAVIDPQAYRFRQADAQRAYADMQISQAGGLDARLKLRDMLVPIMQAAQLTAPKEIDDANLNKQLKDTTTAAAQNLDESDQQLVNVIDGPPGMGPANQISSDLKKSALVSRIFVIFNQQLLAKIQGNKSAVQQKEALARAAVNAAVEAQATFPSLPGDYATYLPAPAAPATTAPAGAPATAPSADASGAGTATTPDATAAPTDATAATPADTTPSTNNPADDQAIHTAMASFISAAIKGDAATAQQFVQIEPGQEDYFNQLTAMFASAQKFSDAMSSKFGGTFGNNNPAMSPNALAKRLAGMHVTIKGDEGYASPAPGTPEVKRFVRVNGQWKFYIGPPDASEKNQRQMIPRLSSAMETMSAKIRNGDYGTPTDVMRDFPKMIASAATPTNTNTQANTTATPPATPPATPQAPAAPQ